MSYRMQYIVPLSTHRARSGRGGCVCNGHRLNLALDTIYLLATCLVQKILSISSSAVVALACRGYRFRNIRNQVGLAAGEARFKGVREGKKATHVVV